VNARDDAEVKRIEVFIEGFLITIIGKITGIFLRNIEIAQARPVQ